MSLLRVSQVSHGSTHLCGATQQRGAVGCQHTLRSAEPQHVMRRPHTLPLRRPFLRRPFLRQSWLGFTIMVLLVAYHYVTADPKFAEQQKQQ